MASTNVSVRQKLLTIIERGVRFDKNAGKAVWRKFVVPGLSRLESFQTHFHTVKIILFRRDDTVHDDSEAL